MRCSGGLGHDGSRRRAWARFDAVATARDEVGDCGALGQYLKDGNRAESGLVRANRARLLNSARIRLELKVEGGSDCRVPPSSGTARGTALSAAAAKGGGGARRGLSFSATRWAVRALAWPW